MNTNHNTKQQHVVIIGTQKSKSFLAIILLTATLAFCENANAQVKDWPGKNVCGTVQPATVSQLKPDTIVNGDSVIIIPTVFHILTQGGAETISKSDVMKGLELLNLHYNRQNPDTLGIPAPFQLLRGNPKLEFRLARLDPQGNCTDGIDRIYTPKTGVLNNFLQMQPNFSWDHTRYMNIYSVRWIDYQTDPGVYNAISYIAPPDSGNNLPAQYDVLQIIYDGVKDGGLLTHEMGHNMALKHIWGLTTGCSDDDDVADTPLQDSPSSGCPAFPHISCSNGPDGDMFSNMMDYSDCGNMFSAGQADRMRSCLANNEWRETLWTPANLVATGVDTLYPVCSNPPVADFGYGNLAGWLCAGEPVQFYEAASVNATSYQWEFTGGIPATSTDTFPSVIFADSGLYNVRLIVSNSFGIDTIEKLIRIEPAEVYYSVSNNSMTEFFEDTVFNQQIPQYLQAGKKWSVTNLAAFSGSNSIRLDSSLQMFSIFFTHIFDLNQITGPGRKLEFKVACGLSFSGSIAGGLRITWKRPCLYDRDDVVYGRGTFYPGDGIIPPDTLRTVITNSVFIPNSNQWKTITMDIPDSLTGEIQIAFAWGSFTQTNKLKGLYIDDIKIYIPPSGVSENTPASTWQLYPNPANDLLVISYPLLRSKEVTVTITDITGKIIYKTTTINSEKIEVKTSDFAEGMYMVQVRTNDFIETKKVIVTK